MFNDYANEKRMKKMKSELDKCITIVENLSTEVKALRTMVDKFQSEDHFRNVYDTKLAHRIWRNYYSDEIAAIVEEELLNNNIRIDHKKLVEELYDEMIRISNSFVGSSIDIYIRNNLVRKIKTFKESKLGLEEQ